ncbi:MAG TPA: MBL fold metallo-hydrolase [Thermoplasmata archaeon]|nr:MBL fold metallo-hydrolase [Thermoplasmata archaeon]
MVSRSRDSGHFTIRPLGPGVWAAEATLGGYGLCNAGIVDLGGKCVVFDTMLTPTAGRDLVRAAQRLTGRRPDYAVNSHWHGDHVRGNREFLPAPIVSTTRTRELVRTLGPEQWRSDLREMPKLLRELRATGDAVRSGAQAFQVGWYEGTLRVRRPFRPVPPDLTFERELVLDGRRRSLWLRSYGGGHSPSDTFAFLPDEKVAFFGDLVTVGMHPSVTDGVPSQWRTMRAKIRKLGIRTAVPGHGPTGGARDVRRIERYLAYIDARGRAAHRRREDRAVLARTEIPAEFQGWRAAEFFGDNLLRAFELHGAR